MASRSGARPASKCCGKESSFRWLSGEPEPCCAKTFCSQGSPWWKACRRRVGERAMVVKVVVGVTVFLVATIAVARGIRAADWALPAVLSAGF